MLSSLRDCLYRGLTESFNNKHLKLSIRKTNETVLDYQRTRRPPVLFVIQGEEVKRVDSYMYLGGQINKKFQDTVMSK